MDQKTDTCNNKHHNNREWIDKKRYIDINWIDNKPLKSFYSDCPLRGIQ